MLIWVILEPFGHPRMDSKRLTKAQKIGGMYDSKSKLRSKPLTKSLSLDNRTIHPAHLQAFEYLFGSIWGSPNGQKQHKSLATLRCTNISQFSNSDTEGVHFLLKHFCDQYSNLDSLKWTILHCIGKVNYDPSGNLLKWERAYIEGLAEVPGVARVYFRAKIASLDHQADPPRDPPPPRPP
jgi:hypothetical protein